MSESLFAAIGRRQLAMENQDAAYTALLNLLAEVVSGTTDRSRVMINLTDRTWSVAAHGQRPAMPSTINGLPLCVVAPEPPPVVTQAPVRQEEIALGGTVNVKLQRAAEMIEQNLSEAFDEQPAQCLPVGVSRRR